MLRNTAHDQTLKKTIVNAHSTEREREKERYEGKWQSVTKERLIRVTRARRDVAYERGIGRARWSIDRQSSVQPSKSILVSTRTRREVQAFVARSFDYLRRQPSERTARDRNGHSKRERERVNPGDSEAEINCFPRKQSDDPFRLRETASIYRRQLRANGPRLSTIRSGTNAIPTRLKIERWATSVESKPEELWFLLPEESPEPCTTDPHLPGGNLFKTNYDGKVILASTRHLAARKSRHCTRFETGTIKQCFTRRRTLQSVNTLYCCILRTRENYFCRCV